MKRMTRSDYLGRHECVLCKADGVYRAVRVYGWLPDAVLCAEHKRQVARAEEGAAEPRARRKKPWVRAELREITGEPLPPDVVAQLERAREGLEAMREGARRAGVDLGGLQP